VSLWIVYPGPHSYPVNDKISALALRNIASLLGHRDDISASIGENLG
jgi:hypothetical protein